MQHPVRQNSPVGQSGRQLTPQGFCPDGHIGRGQELAPPVDAPPAFGVPPPPGLPPAPDVPPPDVPPVFAAPPLPVDVHDAGKVVFPRQSSQVSHLLTQVVLCVQVWHFVASLTTSMEHVDVRRTVFKPPPGNLTSQQPKQSQPLGV
jgi:hypothetical protein